MKPGKPLKRTGFRRKFRIKRNHTMKMSFTLAPRKPLRTRSKNTAKLARVHLRQFGQPAMEHWYHAQPCQLLGRVAGHVCGSVGDRTRIEICHVLTRGSGRGVDVDGKPNIFTGCPAGHDVQGRYTVGQMQARFGVDLWLVAAQQRAQYERQVTDGPT